MRTDGVGLCLEEGEVVTGNRNYNSFKKKNSCWWHMQMRVCNVCSQAESQTHRLPLEVLTKMWTTGNIVTAFKSLHVWLVYHLVGNYRLEAMTKLKCTGISLQDRWINRWTAIQSHWWFFSALSVTMDGSETHFQWHINQMLCAFFFF